ncbi:MAG: hypothetical protein OEM94_02610 [Acidimicrobiia bacterium]|nr:hypothetical protein [Acidimicrobiia bacterium]
MGRVPAVNTAHQPEAADSGGAVPPNKHPPFERANYMKTLVA